MGKRKRAEMIYYLACSSHVSICITLAAIKFWGLNAKNKMVLLFSCIIMKNHVLVVIVSYSARAGITKSIIYYTF